MDPAALRRERTFAWVANVVAVSYFAWMFGFHWRNSGTFAQLYAGLGVQLEHPTRFVVEQGFWLYPTLFALCSAAVVAKESWIDDKRLSVIITFVVTLIAQFIAQAMISFYYLPLLDLMSQLS